MIAKEGKAFNLRKCSDYQQIEEEGTESGQSTRRGVEMVSDDEGSVDSHRCMLKREMRYNKKVFLKVKHILN